jgi:hypothetical protein
MYRIVAYCIALLWINIYICREFFLTEHTGHMNSMHGFWMALGRLASHHWWRPGWWPYWDAGMPFEWTYAPLVPGLTAAWSNLTGVSVGRAFHSVTGLTYVLTPVLLFLFAAGLSRLPGWSFVAAVVYSLTSLTQIVLPDEAFAWSRLLDARRLYLIGIWDEAPHLAALNAILVALLFVGLAIERGRMVYWALGSLFMCVAMLSSAFGLTSLAFGLIGLLLAFGREGWVANSARVLGAGLVAYLVACPWIPPSLFPAINVNQRFHGVVEFGPGSTTAIAIIVLGIVMLAAIFRRLTTDRWLRFASYFAWITFAIPAIYIFLGRSFLPQSGRYKVEAEIGLALVVVFGIRALIDRAPVALRVALALLSVSLAAEQVVNHRKFAKTNLRSISAETSIEYRAAAWAMRNLPGARVWFPGSMGQWFNRWSDGQQLTGSSWSTAYNPVHQKVVSQSVFSSTPEDVANVMLWLRAYGVKAFAIPGPKSPEFWKAIANPQLFDGCKTLWREEDTRICEVPGSSGALAHVIPRDALVGREPRDWRDNGDVKRLNAALDTAAPAELQWQGTDAAVVRANVRPSQVLTIHMTHHPGWSATVNGRSTAVHRDALGLLWVAPDCNGPCEVRLTYRGGWELTICRWISAATLLLILYLTLRRVTTRLPQESGIASLQARGFSFLSKQSRTSRRN